MKIRGGIFPVVEDEIMGFSERMVYIPLQELKKIDPYDALMELELITHYPLSDADASRITSAFLRHLSLYEGELEVKVRLRTKGLQKAAIIEGALMGGMFYSAFTLNYGPFISILRFIMEFMFWGCLIFIPSVIGPAIGGLRYKGALKKFKEWKKNIQMTGTIYRTDYVEHQRIVQKFREIDGMEIYEKMANYIKETWPHYSIGYDFYEAIQERLCPNDSFVTKYLPAGFINAVKTTFDVRVQLADFFMVI